MQSNSQTDFPTDKLDAWTEAEETAFNVLCAATKHERAVNAFIGETPNICNAFGLYNKSVEIGGEVFYAPEHPSFVIPYTATGIFDNRRAIQRWAMAIVTALPVRNVGNLAELRMTSTSIGAIKVASVAFRGEPTERLAYTLDIDFDLVLRVC